MCRILAARAEAPIDVLPFVRAFAERCRASKEFQGHGWGISWREDGAWRSWRSIDPIWESRLPDVPPTKLALIHARSAFRNELIAVENNMPFVEDGLAFTFNGELRGVRLQAPGETGAWRLFHLLRRFGSALDGDGIGALQRLDRVVGARTDYVRALNVAASDGERIWVGSRYSEDPEYFTLWHARVPDFGGTVSLVSSEQFDVPGAVRPLWGPIPNGHFMELHHAAAVTLPAPLAQAAAC